MTTNKTMAFKSTTRKSTTSTTMKVIATCLILSVSMQICYGSAIPIWEFLTRNEKMSYLYSTFAQLVSIHCKSTAATTSVPIPVNQCKRNLLAYGNEKLQSFTDAQLDAIDPYQRDANELIWSSIMGDHPSSSQLTTRKPLPTPPASSIIILTHQKPLQSNPNSTPTIIAATPTNTKHITQNYPTNPLFENDTPTAHKHQYAMDMDIAYGYPSSNPDSSNGPNMDVETFSIEPQNPQTYGQSQETYLTGPLVIRVRPDGTPVQEDQNRPLPRDDDLEHLQLSYTPATIKSTTGINGDGNADTNRRHNKHKIATISSLKQQHLASLALRRHLLPPFEQIRTRRQYQQVVPIQQTNGYFYGPGQS